MLWRRPAGQQGASPPPLAGVIAGALVSFGVFLGSWIALVGEADLQDNIAGLIAAGAGVAAGWFVSVQGEALPSFRRSDLALVAGFGPKLCRQTITIYAATWRRARGQGPPSGVREISTDVGGGGWPAARRSGVVGALLSFTPDTIVIDIDADTGVATVHDFVARPARTDARR